MLRSLLRLWPRRVDRWPAKGAHALNSYETKLLPAVCVAFFPFPACRFFCGYQGLKYAAKLARKEDDFWNVLIASAGSFAPMVAIPAMRSRYPYAAILIAMDTLNNHVL